MAEFQTSCEIAGTGTGTGTGPGTGTPTGRSKPKGATIASGSKNRGVQVRALRSDGWNRARRGKFLRVLGTTCNVRAAAASVGLGPSGAYALRLRDPVFAASWAAALASGYDRLEEALLAAAIAGLSGDFAPHSCEDVGAGAGAGVGAGDLAGENLFGEDLGSAGGTAGSTAVPDTGVVRLASMQAVQVALAMLGRYRAAQAEAGKRQKMRHRRATPEETNASIAKKLDALAKRLAAPVAVIVLGSPPALTGPAMTGPVSVRPKQADVSQGPAQSWRTGGDMSDDQSGEGAFSVADVSDRMALEDPGGRTAVMLDGGLNGVDPEGCDRQDDGGSSRDVIAELAILPAAQRARLIGTLTAAEQHELNDRWEVWAHPGQHLGTGASTGAAADDWRIWVILAGRGFGKTRAGAEWVSQMARDNPGARIALVGATIEDVRRVMIEGESGLLAVARDDEDPVWRAALGELRFGNGALASAYSAEAPEGLRGPEHHVAWCDEVAKWRNGAATWDNLMMGLRLGTLPRIVVTTTPRPVALLRRILALPGVVRSQGRTRDNVHLPASFVESVTATYAGTRLGRQELDGELIEDVAGALWTRDLVETRRVAFAPAVTRVVVGVDPPAGSVSGGPGDACGIVVVALGVDGFAYVLEDASVSGASPEGWARAVAECAERHGADRVIAEANQGGKMVGSVLSGADRAMPVKLVHASLGKVARAEPVAALYEAGRAWHVGAFPALEDELCGLIAGGGYEGPGRSPDRADALVWAMTEVMLGPVRRVSVRVL